MAEEIKVEAQQAPWAPNVALRTDGPTLEEYVAAGYKAENYPPEGYAVRENSEVEGEEAENALQAAHEQHIANSVQPQLTEVEKAVQAKLKAQAEENEREPETEDTRRQQDADEKIVTGNEDGISHMDLLRASFAVDGRLKGIETGEIDPGEPVSPTFHQPVPEGHEPPKSVVWKPNQ